MLLPIGSCNLIAEQKAPANGTLGTIVKLPFGRAKTFHFRAASAGGGQSAVFQALGSNVAKPKNIGDFCPIGASVTLTLTTAATAYSGGIEDQQPWLWVSCQLVSSTGTDVQVEAWVAS